VNSHLRKRGKDSLIENIQTDFCDGIKLIQFLEVISSKNDWSRKVDKNPKLKIQKIQNVDLCMKFLKAEGVKLVAIQAENIVDGDLTLILGMIWTIIQQYQIADISEEELTAKEALLLWCQKKTKGYRDVDPPGIKNFHTSWIDGLALCALIHRHRPDLLDYEKCQKSTPRENCELAFRVAEEKLGIPQLLDVEDLVDTAKPDERSVITYVVQYYHVFASQGKGEQAGRRVGKLVDFERNVQRLKNEYNERAGKLRKWIETKITWLDDKDFGKTEEEIARKLGEYNDYRTKEKPEKASEKLGCEALFNSIQVKLSSNDRPPFTAADGLSPKEINELWQKLLEAEQQREKNLRGARKRERQLNLLNSRLDDKAARLEKWIGTSEEYLARNEPVDSLTAAASKLNELDAWNGEYGANKPSVAELQKLASEIAALNGPTADAQTKRAAAIQSRFDALRGKADAKAADLKKKRELEEAKEAARKTWADAAKAYVAWTQEAVHAADDERYFGDSLEAVSGAKARLDKADADSNATNGTKKKVVDAAWAKLQELGVKENKYSVLTSKDTDAASAAVGHALGARQQAWKDAQALEEKKEAKRKEFAAAAQSFVDGAEKRRGELDGLQGEPEPLIKTLEEKYAGGKPENDGLAKVQTLQNEATALGVTSNKHTPHNLASLKAKAGDLGRFVHNKQLALREEADLKSDYATRAKALLAWRAAAQPKVEDRAASNSLDDARAKLAAFQTYRTAEKADKANEKLALIKLEQQIQALLQKNNRPAFKADAAIAPAAINADFAALDAAEAAKADFLRAYLARMEELDVLVKRFNADKGDLAAWIADKKSYLDKPVEIDTLLKAQHARVVHQSYDEEFAGRAPRVDALGELATKIGSLDYADKAAIAKAAAESRAAYDALKAPAAAKSKAIEAGLAAEQAKEDARIEFASKAKDYARASAIAQQDIADRTFGFTLPAVTAHGAKLDASDAEFKKHSDAGLAAVKSADEHCTSLKTGANPHTKLTLANATASNKAVTDAIAARRADYGAELAKQQRWDAARKGFAADADGFVAWLGEQRKAVQGATGAPDERIAAIKAVHKDGKPGADRVAALAATADKNAADGIVGNDYTGLTVPILKERNEQFNKFVAQALKNQDDEKAYNSRFADLTAALKKAEEKEQEQFDFQRAAKVLLHWLEAEGAFLTEPVHGNTVEDVQAAKQELAEFNKAFHGKEGDYHALQAKAKAVGDSSLLATVTAKWDETKQLAAKRAAALEGEHGTQQEREKLRKQFAAEAEAFNKWLDGQKEKLAGTKGDLEAQKAQLVALTAANAAGESRGRQADAALGQPRRRRRHRQPPHQPHRRPAQARVRAALQRHQGQAVARRAGDRQEEGLGRHAGAAAGVPRRVCAL
jgi:hypothetical protein